jgi:arabinogalactan oligomer/maltooligosaccharide transport system permease protein
MKSRSPYMILKWVIISVVLAGIVYAAGLFAADGQLILVVVLGLIGLAILAVYATRRAVPMKYLLPGLIFFLAFQIWPAVFTGATSLTNWGDGHSLSKQESIDAITQSSVVEVQGQPRYELSVAVEEGQDVATGDPVYILTNPQTKQVYAGTADGLTALPAGEVTRNGLGRVTAVKSYTVLNGRQVNARQDLDTFAVPTQDGAAIKRVGLSEAYEGKPTVTYDAAKDQLVDHGPEAQGQPVKVYAPSNATWVNVANPDDRLAQGWKENVGFANFKNALTNETLRAGFLKIAGWNFFFAIVSVLSTFLLGLALALLFNDERLKGKKLMRTVLILPYALPGFVTALVWASMFNQQFGLINNLTGLTVDWLGNGLAAKFAILLTNLWLGFPYMFIVCTGALQSIPGDVKEAAAIDGASGFRTVRSITMPLVLVAVGPLLIASFAFNFNNFSLIYLMTEGGPFEGGQSAIGSTDLLITYAYRLAFTSAAPNFGYAAAISIFIFLIVAVASWFGFRQTKALEEVN